MEGTITVKSRVGEGTEFKVQLPIRQNQVDFKVDDYPKTSPDLSPIPSQEEGNLIAPLVSSGKLGRWRCRTNTRNLSRLS